ncbi:multiprotein-bridging factor 1 family protein [Mesorhizobium calcicola]|uniref:Multiprotein-bridging factor 1 family protein n=1 Tax=Mesorhizobium calcicola TaxID=1300310 RepID=A0ABW4WNU7_9HYPH
MARVALGWGTRDLARKAGVSPDTVARFERGEDLKDSTLATIRATSKQRGSNSCQTPEMAQAYGICLVNTANDAERFSIRLVR